MFLFEKNNRFNIANNVTYLNVILGVVAIYFIVMQQFTTAIVLAWIAGACDIIDGKLARRYSLSTEFGVQLDSFADFISFVVMPAFLLFYKLSIDIEGVMHYLLAAAFLVYIVSGLIRLIEFNIKTDAGSVDKYFTGIPTPLGAILLWILYLIYSYALLSTSFFYLVMVLTIAVLMNSKVKIPHP